MRRVISALLRRALRWLDDRPKPSAPSEAQLAENVQHVCYELAAMERAAELASKGGRFRFEAFWLHARLLREFFWARSDGSGPGSENSLLAEHYVGDTSRWRRTRGGLPRTLKRTKDRVDRQIAHLARDRHGDFMNIEVEIPGARAELMTKWQQLQDELAPRWTEPFRRSLAKKRQLLEQNEC